MEAMNSIAEIPVSNASTIDIATWRQSCYDAMNDDFNTPILIAQLFEGVRFVNLLKIIKKHLIKRIYNFLQQQCKVLYLMF
jgi:cysteinyl-tRNA synthetase